MTCPITEGDVGRNVQVTSIAYDVLISVGLEDGEYTKKQHKANIMYVGKVGTLSHVELHTQVAYVEFNNGEQIPVSLLYDIEFTDSALTLTEFLPEIVSAANYRPLTDAERLFADTLFVNAFNPNNSDDSHKNLLTECISVAMMRSELYSLMWSTD